MMARHNSLFLLAAALILGCSSSTAPDRSEVLELARTADPGAFTSLQEVDGRTFLALQHGQEYLHLSEQSFEAVVCLSAPEAELCIARNGPTCGLLMRRTGELVEPVTHPCKPNHISERRPCDGYCLSFDDGSSFRAKDGVFHVGTGIEEPKETDCATVKAVPQSSFDKAMAKEDWQQLSALIDASFEEIDCRKDTANQIEIVDKIDKRLKRAGFRKVKLALRVDSSLDGQITTSGVLTDCELAYRGAFGSNIWCSTEGKIKGDQAKVTAECDAPSSAAVPSGGPGSVVFGDEPWFFSDKSGATITVGPCLYSKSRGIVLRKQQPKP